MKKHILWIMIAALLLGCLPFSAFAAQPAIRLGGKVGFMYADMSVTLKPSIRNASASDVVWSTSDSSVATVENGTIRSIAPGRAVITAAVGGVSARCGVVVLPKTISIKTGESYSLPYGTVESYAVQHSSVASVTKNGIVTGKGEGTTLVRVRSGKQTLYVQVEVNDMDATALQSEAAKLECAAQADQIVLVDYISGSRATLTIHEKRSGVWTQLYSCDAYVGKNGIGKTKEGDRKTPVGTFNLTTPFGIYADPGAKQNYTQVTKYHYWCGTSDSKYYNQFIDMREVDRKYTSSDEYLINYKGEYNYCMFVDYNASGAAGKGSCIFLHCMGKNQYTSGCIAIPEKVMKRIIQWAEPGAKIVIR